MSHHDSTSVYTERPCVGQGSPGAANDNTSHHTRAKLALYDTVRDQHHVDLSSALMRLASLSSIAVACCTAAHSHDKPRPILSCVCVCLRQTVCNSVVHDPLLAAHGVVPRLSVHNTGYSGFRCEKDGATPAPTKIAGQVCGTNNGADSVGGPCQNGSKCTLTDGGYVNCTGCPAGALGTRVVTCHASAEGIVPQTH